MKKYTAPLVAANLPKTDDKFLTYGQGMLTKLTNNVKLDNPPVSLAVFGGHLAIYGTAIVAASHGGVKATADRESAKQHVIDDINLIKAYIQAVSNMQLSAEESIAVILGGGMMIKKVGKHFKPDLNAKNSNIPGTVSLSAHAMKKRGVWYFEYSTDQKTWVLGAEELKSRAKLTGLTTMTTYYFRYRMRTSKAGLGDYSQIVSLWIM